MEHMGIPTTDTIQNTLSLFNIAMVKPWPIEIDGLPGFTELKNGGSFHVKQPDGNYSICDYMNLFVHMDDLDDKKPAVSC